VVKVVMVTEDNTEIVVVLGTEVVMVTDTMTMVSVKSVWTLVSVTLTVEGDTIVIGVVNVIEAGMVEIDVEVLVVVVVVVENVVVVTLVVVVEVLVEVTVAVLVVTVVTTVLSTSGYAQRYRNREVQGKSVVCMFWQLPLNDVPYQTKNPETTPWLQMDTIVDRTEMIEVSTVGMKAVAIPEVKPEQDRLAWDQSVEETVTRK
jgi:hypothetical protein